MKKEALENLLNQVAKGELDVSSALGKLKDFPYGDLGFAKIDHHRAFRQGFPEVIFCPSKTNDQIYKIFESLLEKENDILATRANLEVFEKIKPLFPEAKFFEGSKAIVVEREKDKKRYSGPIVVCSAGTGDFPVAQEAIVTASLMGHEVVEVFDVGVAGIHRLLDKREILWKASVIVVIAGMEGALASVVGGMVDCPVIAVPTSVGYGTGFGGFAALLSMLNSCSAGVVVVNIDNGFGAGFAAAKINQKIQEGKKN